MVLVTDGQDVLNAGVNRDGPGPGRRMAKRWSARQW